MAFWTRLYRALISLSPGFKRDYGDDAARDYSRLVQRQARRRGRGASAKLAVLGALDALKVAASDRASDAPMLRSLGPDVRQALRMYRREPLLALAIGLTLAVGIGTTTAAYSLVNDLLVRDLPVRDEDRLVAIYGTNARSQEYYGSYPAILDFAQAAAFEWVGGTRNSSSTWVAPDGAKVVAIQRVTDRFFSALGVPLASGREFAGDEADAVVLSPGFAQRHFGGAEAALGQRLVLDDGAVRVVGVLAQPLEIGRPGDLYRAYNPTPNDRTSRAARAVFIVARLRPGVSLEQAQMQAAAIQKNAAAFEPREADFGVRVTSLRPEVLRKLERPLWTIFGGAIVVLIVAFTSALSLLMSRAASRSGEVAMRVSLGASRARLSRMWTIEAIALAAPGAAAGVAMAYGLVALVRASLPPGPGRLNAVTLDGTAVAAAGFLLVLSALGFSLAPRVLGLSRMRMVTVRDASRSVAGLRRARWQSGLIAGQVALSVVLVCCAVWLAASMARLQATPLGVDVQDVVLADYDLTNAMRRTRGAGVAFGRRVLEQAHALGGVESAALSSALPGTRTSSFVMTRARIDAPEFGPSEEHKVAYFSVTPSYFDIFRLRPLAGRVFDERETANPGRTLVVSRSFATRYFPDGAVGAQTAVFGMPAWEIVGVVDDVHANALGWETDPQVYMPSGAPGPGMVSALVLRLKDGRQLGALELQEMFRRLDPAVVVRVMPMTAAVAEILDVRRVATRSAYALAAIALFLAAINVYGLAALTVVQRKREIGIRMALGAIARDAVAIVVRRGAVWIAAGAAAGLLAAIYLAGPAIRSQLYETRTGEPMLIAAAAAIVFAIALSALWIPARRAAAIDPAITLRAE